MVDGANYAVGFRCFCESGLFSNFGNSKRKRIGFAMLCLQKLCFALLHEPSAMGETIGTITGQALPLFKWAQSGFVPAARSAPERVVG